MTRENSKVHKLIDFSLVINLHYLPCETEKCHTDDVVYFEEFDLQHSLELVGNSV